MEQLPHLCTCPVLPDPLYLGIEDKEVQNILMNEVG
jgi:hypothetical protein